MATDVETAADLDDDMQTQPSAELVLQSPEKLAEVISGMTEVDSSQTLVETRFRIVAEMLAAETEDDLWTELPSWSSKENVGRQFLIGEIRGVFQSRYPDPETGLRGGFLACSAVSLDGKAVSRGADGELTQAVQGQSGIFTTSALRIAGKLGWHSQHDKLPLSVEVVERTKSAEGFPILDIEKL